MVDVVDGHRHAIHHAHVHDIVVVFGEVILLGHRFEAGGLEIGRLRSEAGQRGFVGAELDVLFKQPRPDHGQKKFGDRPVHEQRFHGVADAGPLHLGVHHDIAGHFQVGIRIHKHVADALVMLDHGHLATLGHGANESLAAARHAEVNVLGERKQDGDGVALRGGHHLDGVGGKTAVGDPAGFDHDFGDELVGVQRLLATAQDGGVAGFEAQARRVCRDVGARLVNDHHHADRRGDFPELKSVGTGAFIEDASHGVRQHNHLAQTAGHAGDAFVVQSQPVQQGVGQAVAGAEFQVERVGLLEGVRVLLQGGGHGEQAGILLRRGQLGQRTRSHLGVLRQAGHLFSQIHGFQTTNHHHANRTGKIVKRRQLSAEGGMRSFGRRVGRVTPCAPRLLTSVLKLTQRAALK